VEDIKIADSALAASMAAGAIARADLAKASIEKQIKLTNAEADKQATVLAAEGQGRATGILAEAEAQRVRVLDDALAAVRAPLTQQRELMLAAGEVLKGAHATLVMTQSPADAMGMLASSGAMGTVKALGGAGAR
jgi:regulator of protease activity HflC (stomatin/prohibitin superfamily)